MNALEEPHSLANQDPSLPRQEASVNRYVANRYVKVVGLSVGLLGIGAVLGLVLGLVAGILLTPRSGRESREFVRRGVGQAVSRGRSYVDRVRCRNGDDAEETAEQ